TFAGWLWPEASVTTRRVALPTTCALVTTSPRASKTTPEPRSCDVRICTTDGETARTTPTSSCCSEAAPSADASGATRVTSSPARPPPQAARAAATPASAAMTRCLVMSPWSGPLVLQRLAGRRDDPPRGAEAVAALAGGLARPGVAGERIQRVARVGGLERAVRALRRPEQRGLDRAACLRGGGDGQRRPRLRAGPGARALGAMIGVPEIER